MSKTILITGATDGIGLLTAQKLLSEGHHVLVHGRNINKLNRLEKEFDGRGYSHVDYYLADLSNLEDTQRLCLEIMEKNPTIDVIINNAGVLKTATPTTHLGLDIRFVVNTLAPYLIYQSLRSAMTAHGRVVNLSSAAQAPVDFALLKGEIKTDDEFSAYAQSKLAITMWSRYLADQSGENGPSIIAVNPGSLLASKMVKEGFGVAGKDLTIGADILVKAALSAEFSNASGKYFDNDIGQFSNAHHDVENSSLCQKLVDEMERLLGSVNTH